MRQPSTHKPQPKEGPDGLTVFSICRLAPRDMPRVGANPKNEETVKPYIQRMERRIGYDR